MIEDALLNPTDKLNVSSPVMNGSFLNLETITELSKEDMASSHCPSFLALTKNSKTQSSYHLNIPKSGNMSNSNNGQFVSQLMISRNLSEMPSMRNVTDGIFDEVSVMESIPDELSRCSDK